MKCILLWASSARGLGFWRKMVNFPFSVYMTVLLRMNEDGGTLPFAYTACVYARVLLFMFPFT